METRYNWDEFPDWANFAATDPYEICNRELLMQQIEAKAPVDDSTGGHTPKDVVDRLNKFLKQSF